MASSSKMLPAEVAESSRGARRSDNGEHGNVSFNFLKI